MAVLPLENLSDDPDDEYFADGMTEALITELGKVHALRVISRRSVMQYKGTTKPVQQIAKELNVDALIEGSALRANTKVRITAQLVQAKPERHLWSESYERNLSDVISLQREVVQAITREIRVSLTPQEQQRLSQIHSVLPEAYEAYLKAIFFSVKLTPEGLKKSFDLFQQAISKDPTYAPAYVGLAQAYMVSGDRNLFSAREAYAKSSPLVMKALALDDTCADAHYTLANLLDSNWDWAGAEREYLRAIDLDPGNARAHHWFSDFLLRMGRFEDAVAENERARQLDPTHVLYTATMAIRLAYAGRYEDALQQARTSVEMDSDFAPAHFALGLAYTRKGMSKEAITELERAVALPQGYSGYEGFLAYSYALFGRAADACRVAERMELISVRAPVASADLATAYAACGNNGKAMGFLEKGYREHDLSLASMRVDFTLDKLRADPRFQKLLGLMMFPTK